jgi:hypothetical protein
MAKVSGHLARFTVVAICAVAVSACSGTDVELKGGVFDAMGISNLNSKSVEPQLANRPGIVIPPSTASLPKPGAPPAPVAADNGEAFPVNQEDARKARAVETVQRHRAFCEKSRQKYDAGMTATLEDSPWGPCNESVLRNLTGKDLGGRSEVTVK